MILADSNILIDLFAPDQLWYDWSAAKVAEAAAADGIAINPIVVAEVGPRMGSLERLIDKLASIGIDILDLSNEAAFAAGAAFNAYRAARTHDDRAPKSVLADFFMGGHAATLGVPILTRDPRFYRRYFPTLPLITPETENG